MNNTEIEVRFLEINPEEIKQKLLELGAVDEEEDFLKEVIFYNKDLSWKKESKRARLRTDKHGTKLAYKHTKNVSVDGTEEIEIDVSDFDNAIIMLERFGLTLSRFQEKKRHTFVLGDVTIDIDTWPKIPSYVELEGPSETHLKEVVEKLGLDWANVTMENAGMIIENVYKIPVRELHYFTFDRVE